jgi:hypothetical protein
MALVDRYAGGEQAQVVRELLALGESVWSQRWRDEARAVATEIVGRARANLQQSFGKLGALGYRFMSPGRALVTEPTPSNELDQFEVQFGRLPMLTRAWFESLGRIDFRQDRDQFRDPNSPLAGLGWNAFFVQSLSEARDKWLARVAEFGLQGEMASPYLLLGGAASNCDPKCQRLPSNSFDAPVYNDGNGDVYFYDELRALATDGGLPVLTLLSRGDSVPVGCRTPEFDAVQHLAHGLRPI